MLHFPNHTQTPKYAKCSSQGSYFLNTLKFRPVYVLLQCVIKQTIVNFTFHTLHVLGTAMPLRHVLYGYAANEHRSPVVVLGTPLHSLHPSIFG
jgi:hypothetical protein